MSSVALRSKVPGSVRADVRDFNGRAVVWAEVDATDRKGALTSESSSMLEHAAQTACSKKLPLIGVLRSSGADIVEGFSALHGWGKAARALTDCSGVVPTILIVDGPAVSGPALLLGIADHVVMTDAAYAFVSGPSMVADAVLGKRHRFGWGTGLDVDDDGVVFASNRLVRYDALTGGREVLDLGADCAAGEVVFVPRTPTSAEDDGWFLTLAQDQTTATGELLVIDAGAMADGPVARVQLPGRIPLGFHGNWVPSS